MKTPRELLLARHRAAVPKLDAIRAGIPATVPDRPAPAGHCRVVADSRANWSLRDLVRSLRWHLAGMSAVWLLVVAFNAGKSAPPPRAVATHEIPPAQVIFASLRENRRLLGEFAGFSEPRAIDPPKAFLRPRTELRFYLLIG